MKTMISRLVSFMLVLALSMSLSIPAFAKDQIDNTAIRQQVITSDGIVEVRIPQQYANALSYDELQEIVSDENIKNGDVISIEKVVTFSDQESAVSPNFVIIPPIQLYRYTTNKSKTGGEYVKKNVFVASVSKGQTKTIEQKITATLKTTISGTYYVDLGLDASITVEVKKGETRTGPPENSEYNSREYRIKFFAQNYKWTQNKYYMATGEFVSQTSGTASVPTKYAEYCIDSKQ